MEVCQSETLRADCIVSVFISVPNQLCSGSNAKILSNFCRNGYLPLVRDF